MSAISMMQTQWMPSKKQVGLRLCWERCKGGYFSDREKFALTVSGKTAEGTCVKAGSRITTGESTITVPSDLFTGDIWVPTLGKITRENKTVQSTPVQNLSAAKGIVKVWQIPATGGLPAVLSATVAVARAEEEIHPIHMIPTTYQKLSYIVSTGTQYIDTEIVGGSDAGYNILFETTDDPNAVQDTDCYFAGRSASTPGSLLRTWLYGYAYVTFEKRDGSNTIASERLLPVGSSASIAVSSTAVTCNGDTVPFFDGLPKYGWGDLSWYLFSSHEEPHLCSEMKLYGLTMTVNGGADTVRSFIPCRRTADGEIGLYDTVSGRFFMNIGTGSFTAGDL